MLPIVVVTNANPRNARKLGLIRVEGVVWTHEIQSRLHRVVKRLARSSYRHRLAAYIDSQSGLDPIIARALVRGCQRDVPVQSVNGLVRLAGVDRSTFWRHWRAIFRPDQLQPKGAVDLLISARAAELLVTGLSWDAVEAQLNVNQSLIVRVLKRVTGAGEVTDTPPGELLNTVTSLFEDAMAPLYGHATTSGQNETNGALRR